MLRRKTLGYDMVIVINDRVTLERGNVDSAEQECSDGDNLWNNNPQFHLRRKSSAICFVGPTLFANGASLLATHNDP